MGNACSMFFVVTFQIVRKQRGNRRKVKGKDTGRSKDCSRELNVIFTRLGLMIFARLWKERENIIGITTCEGMKYMAEKRGNVLEKIGNWCCAYVWVHASCTNEKFLKSTTNFLIPWLLRILRFFFPTNCSFSDRSLVSNDWNRKKILKEMEKWFSTYFRLN